MLIDSVEESPTPRAEEVVCTVASGGFVGRAMIALESVLAHTATIRRGLLLITDGAPMSGVESDHPIVAVHAHEVLDEARLRELSFIYSPGELATTLKPHAIAFALDAMKAERVVFVDGDTLATASLQPVLDLLRRKSVVLFPHSRTPMTGPVNARRDKSILAYGVYNGGVVAVAGGDEGQRFVEWWAERVMLAGRRAPEFHEFYDQRWLDLVPALFENSHTRGIPGVNVGHWNLHELEVCNGGDEPRHNGEPLRLLHFSNVEFDMSLPPLQTRVDAPAPIAAWWTGEAIRYRQLAAQRSARWPHLSNRTPRYPDGSAIPTSHRDRAFAVHYAEGSLGFDPYTAKKRFAATQIRAGAGRAAGALKEAALGLKQVVGSVLRIVAPSRRS